MVNKTWLRLKVKLGEFCLGAIPLLIILVYFGDANEKNDGEIGIAKIKQTRATNFISDISRRMGFATWDLGKPRINQSNEFKFSNGKIRFLQCSPNTKHNIEQVFEQYRYLTIKEHKTFGKYFCIDNNIVINIDSFGNGCDLIFSIQWDKSYSNCSEILLDLD